MKIHSKNKKILVLSDVHQEIDKLKFILNHEDYDVCVHLGDFFDSHYKKSQEDVGKTCGFIKKYINNPNFYFLWGNHCLQYFYKNQHLYCSGYNTYSDEFISNFFGTSIPEIRNKMLWYFWIDDFFCSHAGLNAHHFLPRQELTINSLSSWLDKEIESAELCLIQEDSHWLYACGQGRGGQAKVGGITWQDFRKEFEPIDGLKQLVGHSRRKKIEGHPLEGTINLEECDNLNIDCGLFEYLIISNGKLQIKKYADL